MTLLSTPELITLLIASYGAGLSTIGLIMRYIDRRLRIRVIVYNSLTFFGLSEEAEKAITIVAANLGGRKTTLSNFKFLLTGGGQFLWMDPQSVDYIQDPHPLPYEFAPGQQDFTIAIRMQSVAAALRKNDYSGVIPFKAVFDSVAGKQHESIEMRFDIENVVVLGKPIKRAFNIRPSKHFFSGRKKKDD